MREKWGGEGAALRFWRRREKKMREKWGFYCFGFIRLGVFVRSSESGPIHSNGLLGQAWAYFSNPGITSALTNFPSY